MTRRVAHRPEPAHREAGDRPTVAVGARLVARLDERAELVEVERLPALRALGRAAPPVGVPTAGSGIRHHDDHREMGGERLGITDRRPVCRRPETAVEEPQHGQVIAAGVEAVGREDPHVCVVRERGAVDAQLGQPGRELLSGPQLESGGAGRGRRHDEPGSNECDQQAEHQRARRATAPDHAIAPDGRTSAIYANRPFLAAALLCVNASVPSQRRRANRETAIVPKTSRMPAHQTKLSPTQ